MKLNYFSQLFEDKLLKTAKWPAYREFGEYGKPALRGLILLFSCFLTIPLARQCFFYSTALARFQVKGVTLHFLNDVFLLNLALKPAQCIFKRFAFLHTNLCQMNHTSKHPNWVITGYVTFEA